MNGIGNWFRKIGRNFSAGMRKFMTGRYGTDKLNMTILTCGLIMCLVGMFFPRPVNQILTLLSYGLMFWAIFRTFSRNTYRRYEENRKYLLALERIKDRKHRYFNCPKCHQPIRVPRGKGKIAITCPRCKERFVRKT